MRSVKPEVSDRPSTRTNAGRVMSMAAKAALWLKLVFRVLVLGFQVSDLGFKGSRRYDSGWGAVLHGSWRGQGFSSGLSLGVF